MTANELRMEKHIAELEGKLKLSDDTLGSIITAFEDEANKAALCEKRLRQTQEAYESEFKMYMELAIAVQNKIKTWDALGRCYDEFEGYGLAESSCGEYSDADDTAMLKLKAAYETPILAQFKPSTWWDLQERIEQGNEKTAEAVNSVAV